MTLFRRLSVLAQHLAPQGLQNDSNCGTISALLSLSETISASQMGPLIGSNVVTALHRTVSEHSAKTQQHPEQPHVQIGVAGRAKGSVSVETTVDADQCGQDSFFITQAPVQHGSLVAAFGVADGVGGYSEIGVDSSLMARGLMKNAARYFAEHSSESSPIDALRYAFAAVKSDKKITAGGSTACIIALHRRNKVGSLDLVELSSANLGDSGFLVIRNKSVLYRSVEQQYAFNTPYQLSIPMKGHKVIQNTPDQADRLLEPIVLQHDDLVLVATDGLFDNLSDGQLIDSIQSDLERGISVQQIVVDLVKQARRVAEDAHAETPFSKNAQKNGIPLHGGKLDDITAILVRIV